MLIAQRTAKRHREAGVSVRVSIGVSVTRSVALTDMDSALIDKYKHQFKIGSHTHNSQARR